MAVTGTTSSFGVLRAYLQARASFTDAELAHVESMFAAKALQANEHLQRAGAVATHAAFVAKGCLRTYVIDEEGREHVVKFAPETWWVADAVSIATGAPTRYFVQALEDSEVLLISGASHDALVEKVPPFAAAFQKGLQRHAAAKDERIVTSLSTSAQDRYLQFLQTYPSLAGRVPQWMVASYLGLTPETVSRIRRKLARK